jgi:hypothetical protein
MADAPDANVKLDGMQHQHFGSNSVDRLSSLYRIKIIVKPPFATLVSVDQTTGALAVVKNIFLD